MQQLSGMKGEDEKKEEKDGGRNTC